MNRAEREVCQDCHYRHWLTCPYEIDHRDGRDDSCRFWTPGADP
jgi:hypothetical protein